MSKITGILVNPEDGTARKATIEKSLDSYYAALSCSTIDIVSRKIGKQRFDIICDDEGLLKDDPRVSAIDHLGRPMLVGKLFVVKFDGGEDVRSLTDSECQYVLRNIATFATRHHAAPYPMIYPCDY